MNQKLEIIADSPYSSVTPQDPGDNGSQEQSASRNGKKPKLSAKSKDDCIINKTSHREFKMKESEKPAFPGGKREMKPIVTLQRLKEYSNKDLRRGTEPKQSRAEPPANLNIETIHN